MVLARTDRLPGVTLGSLSVDDGWECFTLEDEARPDGIKIAGETAIPPGQYDVEITWSPRFRRQLPLLLNVKGFVGVRIHPGNSPRDTAGCVLVGQALGPDRTILRSRAAFEHLFARLAGAKSRDEPIGLLITQP